MTVAMQHMVLLRVYARFGQEYIFVCPSRQSELASAGVKYEGSASGGSMDNVPGNNTMRAGIHPQVLCTILYLASLIPCHLDFLHSLLLFLTAS